MTYSSMASLAVKSPSWRYDKGQNNISIDTINIINRSTKPYISRIFIKNDFFTLVGGAGTFYI